MSGFPARLNTRPSTAPPEGTRPLLPPASAQRQEVIGRLRRLFQGWGYESVELPALERYDPSHRAADKAFKLSDKDSGVLALRSDFTPAIANLVRAHFPEAASDSGAAPKRLQYCGALWQAIDPDIARTREFNQLGLELVGVSNPRADAELIHLAREAVREVGLTPRVEMGNPGFVRALFSLAGLSESLQARLADAIDRKDMSTLQGLLGPAALAPDLRRAILTVPDLWGEADILARAHALAPWPETRTELERLEAILSEFEDASELLLELGMARRLAYYTGVTFRAYTFDYAQPLLGGGRYDGALLPYAAGFAIGLERLMSALPHAAGQLQPLVLSLDDPRARVLRAAGVIVERSLETDLERARLYARRRGIPLLLSDEGLEALIEEAPEFDRLERLLGAAGG